MTIGDLKRMIEELDDDMPVTIQTYDKETEEISGCKFIESANILENKEEEDGFQKVLCLNDTLHKNLSKITAGTNAFVINQLFPSKVEYVNTLGQYRDNGILSRFPYGYKLVDYKTGEDLDITSYDDEKKYADCNVVYMAPSCDADDYRMSIHLEVL